MIARNIDHPVRYRATPAIYESRFHVVRRPQLLPKNTQSPQELPSDSVSRFQLRSQYSPTEHLGHRSLFVRPRHLRSGEYVSVRPLVQQARPTGHLRAFFGCPLIKALLPFLGWRSGQCCLKILAKLKHFHGADQHGVGRPVLNVPRQQGHPVTVVSE